MIGQYLSNTNEISTIYILQKILELNKASTQSQWNGIQASQFHQQQVEAKKEKLVFFISQLNGKSR